MRKTSKSIIILSAVLLLCSCNKNDVNTDSDTDFISDIQTTASYTAPVIDAENITETQTAENTAATTEISEEQSVTVTTALTETQTTTSSQSQTVTTTTQTAIETSQTTTSITTSAISETPDEETDVTSSEKEYPALTALTDEQENKLKEDFAVYRSYIWTEAQSEEMFVMSYYGTYNGNEVVVMWGSGYDRTADLKEVTVGDRTFMLTSGSYEILLHKDSGFIDINTAYSERYLTDEDIEAIYYYANNP